MKIPVLETERLWVRPFALDDLADCHQLFDLETKTEPQSLDDRRNWLAWAVMNYEELHKLDQPPYGDRAVALKPTGELVGSVGLVPCLGLFDRLPSYGGNLNADYNQSEFGLFWATRTAHQNKGYATEAARALIGYAFTALNLRRIVATTDYDNVRSQAVMRRLGMTIEHNPHPEPKWIQVVGVLENSGR